MKIKLICGLPVSDDALKRHQEDFGQCVWRVDCAKYHEQVVVPFYELREHILACGVNICEQGTVKDLREFTKEFDVVAILSHRWRPAHGGLGGDECSGKVLFHDGAYNVEDVAAEFSDTFSGIVDLGVCYAHDLVCSIKKRTDGRCLVAYKEIGSIDGCVFNSDVVEGKAHGNFSVSLKDRARATSINGKGEVPIGMWLFHFSMTVRLLYDGTCNDYLEAYRHAWAIIHKMG